MKKKLANAVQHSDREYREAFQMKLKDADMSSAVVVKPIWRMRRTHPIPLRIEGVDIATAKRIGRVKGLPYQTLLKVYIREGIERDRKLITRN